MKANHNNIRLGVILITLNIILFSCEYETSIRDAEYPEQLVYLPSANFDGLFIINDLNRVRGSLPFDGNPYRYVVDTVKRNFQIPLSVYRAGINNKGEFKVNIKTDGDTVNNLNSSGNIPYFLDVLPQQKYSIADEVKMKDNSEVAQFDLNVDLDYLINAYPSKLFAIGVNISCEERKVNSQLSTTVVVIDTKIFKPTANFIFSFRRKCKIYKYIANGRKIYLGFWRFFRAF